MENIFIQIAAYRDPELLPTLRDCISKAYFPENLIFSICWQHSATDEWDTLNEFKDDDRFKIIDISYKDSKGVCWARNLLQQQYAGETYTLQLDSHHRFTPDWDIQLIKMLKDLQSKGYRKTLLTTYLPFYDDSTESLDFSKHTYFMEFKEFTPDGVVFFAGYYIDEEIPFEPVPAKFYSAHFCFTLGQFCKEVQHDPNYYFYGEEISIAARAYTHGYDLFHPHKIVLFHSYHRDQRRKHWEDDNSWWKKDQNSLRRNRILFGMERGSIDFGKFGFGTTRSLEDYERYTGLDFKSRTYKNL